MTVTWVLAVGDVVQVVAPARCFTAQVLRLRDEDQAVLVTDRPHLEDKRPSWQFAKYCHPSPESRL